jgi:peptide deformylase
MAVRQIIEHPDARLRALSDPVARFDADLANLVQDLFDTLAGVGGIGLSAPQLGHSVRALVVAVPEDGFGPRAYINPEILDRSRPGIVEESCFSVPGIVGNVIRSTRVRVRARAVDGSAFETTVDGMHAVALQHETDHLDGRLFIDRLSWFRRFRLRRAEQRAARLASA